MTSFERVEHFCATAPFEEVEAFLYDVLDRSFVQVQRHWPVKDWRPEYNIRINSLASILAARDALRDGEVDARGGGHFRDAVRSAEKFFDGVDPASEVGNVAYRALRIARRVGRGTEQEQDEREEKELARQVLWISRRRNSHLTKETLAAVDAYIADGLLIEDE